MLGSHNKAVLQFSGGKDSTALMYLARPWLDRITVIFAETGATFPHLVKHIEDTCERLDANLVVIRPPIDVHQYTRDNGLPADVVPVEASAAMLPFLKPPPAQLLQPYTQCCGAMLWAPMLRYTRENGVDLVLRGSKASDRRVGVGPSVEVEGTRYTSPLWDCSDDDVYAYLAQQGATLPEHYGFAREEIAREDGRKRPDAGERPVGINDSLDCWLCTAHLAHHGDEKMRFIRENYPDLWPIVAERVTRVQAVLAGEIARISPAMDVVTA
jgi:3'-phosphoadenosine 5'-phosphosulfate sulfotransferase (PAPS reductase)/FAD synthetase